MKRPMFLLGFFLLFYPFESLAQQAVLDKGIQAEVAGNWDEAIRIYKSILAEEPHRVDLWLRIADIEAHVNRPEAAAEATRQAALLSPHDATIHFRLAQAYAVANQPKPALEAIRQAVALEPTHLEYLRVSAQLANWNSDYKIAQESYVRILQSAPNDDSALLGLARVKNWSGDLDGAARTYHTYVSSYPQDFAARIEYARIETWRGDYFTALEILEKYRQDFGESDEYFQEKARVFALAPRPKATMAIILPRLANDPDNYDLHLFHTLALVAGHRPREALEGLATLTRLQPDRPETESARRIVTTFLRPAVTAGFNFYGDSDGLRIYHFSLEGGYSIRPENRLQVGIETDQLHARRGSGLEQNNGETDIRHSRGWLGFSQHVFPDVAVDARLGGAAVEGDRQILTYRLGTDLQVEDRLSLRLERDDGFYLVSPRSLDFGVKRVANRLQMRWDPSVRYHLDASVGYDTFSDGNSRWEFAVAPRRAVIRSGHFNMDLGLRAWLFGFRKDLHHGYWSPERYQSYSFTSFGYWKISDSDGVGYVWSLGAQKDSTTDNFRVGGSAAVEGTFGLYRDWLVKLRGTILYNGRSESGAFNAYGAEITLTRRF